MREHATRRPMPVEESILWKPLHDSHYIVASLQASDGGRRRIFIRQRVLADAQQASHAAHGRRIFGLLLGNLYECPVTNVNYLVIESMSEQTALSDDEVADGIGLALRKSQEGQGAHVLGWYRSVAVVSAAPPLSVAAVHATYFRQPWQTALVLADTASPSSGAFFLKDSVNSRWFYAPFLELTEHMPTGSAAKTTCIAWPQYLTAESVVLDVSARAVPPTPNVAERGKLTADSARADYSVPVERAQRAAPTVDKPVPAERTDPVWSPLTDRSETPAPKSAAVDNASEPTSLADRAVPTKQEEGLADRPSRPANEASDSSERGRSGFLRKASRKLYTVDDLDQRRASRGAMRLVSDDDDTTPSDSADQYIDLARAEGFFVAARFDAGTSSDLPETLWVLNEPYSGFLLTVATAGNEVVDATLHYNLHTDDAGLRRIPFPEHRDPESHTIYVRETCIESLRARCKRIRGTGALVREWKVSPAMSFITPGEWHAIAISSVDEARNRVSSLNATRVSELPEGVRTQFRLPASEEPPRDAGRVNETGGA